MTAVTAVAAVQLILRKLDCVIALCTITTLFPTSELDKRISGLRFQALINKKATASDDVPTSNTLLFIYIKRPRPHFHSVLDYISRHIFTSETKTT